MTMTNQTNYHETQAAKRPYLLLAAAGAILLPVLLLVGWQLAGGNLLVRLATFLGGLLPGSLAQTVHDQVQLMGLPLADETKAYWYLARAAGVVAYLLLWLSTIWGIMMSSKLIKGVVGTPVAYGLHEYLPILSVIFAAVHAVVLLGDSYIDFSVWNILVPFTSPYRPVWTGLGSIALYLSIALIISFYIRKRITQKVWRAFHYTAYITFLLALLHGIWAGTDTGTSVMTWIYYGTGLLSFFLVLYRMLTYVPRPAARRPVAGSGD